MSSRHNNCGTRLFSLSKKTITTICYFLSKDSTPLSRYRSPYQSPYREPLPFSGKGRSNTFANGFLLAAQDLLKETLINSVRRMSRWIFRLTQAKTGGIQLRGEAESHPCVVVF
jgi:hypothetical protein